jgi:hypothetical protein
MAEDRNTIKAFEDWLLRGPGEAMFGGTLKAAAAQEKRRLQARLANGQLFPHLEHEDRVKLEKAERERRRGQQMVDRCRARTKTIKALMPSPSPKAVHK